MIKSKIRMPLLCWQCLSKDVQITPDGKVVCPEPNCGFTVSPVEWMDLAMGSLPTEVPQQWDVRVVDRQGKEVLWAQQLARPEGLTDKMVQDAINHLDATEPAGEKYIPADKGPDPNPCQICGKTGHQFYDTAACIDKVME